MRVLFATGTPAGYMAPPTLSDEQIVCGPDWKDERDPDGRWRSLQTPAGQYDLGAIVAKLPPEQQPDAIVTLVDASWRNLPRNWNFFRGPKILLVADTHHMMHPLTGMASYACSEPFDRIVFLYDRHHFPIFSAIGLKNLHWFPGLTFPHDDAAVTAANRVHRERQIAFVGQAGKFHPRRARLLAAMHEAALPVTHKQFTQREGLNFYGASLIGFNASLNGDLNLRVFETLASGAMLLTDRLTGDSGLLGLWAEGRELVTYGTPGELVERARHFLNTPDAARKIGEAGARWFVEHFGAAWRRTAFQRLALEGVSPPEFEIRPENGVRIVFSSEQPLSESALETYEDIQELHRTQETVRVSMADDVPDYFLRLCQTLPRVQAVRETTPTGANAPDWRVINCTGPVAPLPLEVTRLFCCNLVGADAEKLKTRLAEDGLLPLAGSTDRFERRAVVAPPAPPTTSLAPPVLRPDGNGKIVLLYSDEPNPHGVANYNHALLLALVAAGWTVCTAHPRFDSPLIEAQQAAGIRHYWTTWNWGQRFVHSMIDCDEPDRILATVKPDLVVFSDCWPISNIAAKHMVIKRDLPYIVVCHSGDLGPGKTFPASLPVVAKQFAQAREVVAVAGSSLKVLREHYGLPANKGRVIWNGRPAEYFKPSDPAATARLRSQLELPEKSILCFTAARFDALKGYQYQLGAIHRLITAQPNLPVYFAWAGTGHLQEQFAGEIAKLGLQARIRMLGHQGNITEWLGAADIFILTTMLEAMPLSVLEAMAKGVPVIATAVGGIPEELGDTGKLLPDPNSDPAGTVLQLTDTLEKWARNAVLRKKVGAAGRQRAVRYFRGETMIATTISLIETVAGRSAAPAGTA